MYVLRFWLHASQPEDRCAEGGIYPKPNPGPNMRLNPQVGESPRLACVPIRTLETPLVGWGPCWVLPPPPPTAGCLLHGPIPTQPLQMKVKAVCSGPEEKQTQGLPSVRTDLSQRPNLLFPTSVYSSM